MFKRHPSPVQPINVGSSLHGRYHLLEQLGQGGAGIIYKAEDEQLKRIVALKVLHADGGMAGDKLERFRSEARSVARLNHPNIVTLYDYAEQGAQPYLVMEYVPGQDLWELDNGYAPNLMPITQSLPIIDGILAALEYSHSHQVVHRDLKPENVMITPDGQIKVMDFGLARIQGQSRLTQEGLVAGTASYLAPELALGEPGDHRADLYALGVMMYELLTGRLPFSGDDPLTVISQHIHAPVVPPQRYNPNISDELQAIILKLMAKTPADRYATAADARQDLAPILLSLREDAAPPPQADSPRSQGLEADTTHQAILERISRGKMIGREVELAELKRRWDLVRRGESGLEPVVLISGESGIGKTRLLRELQVYAGLRDGYVLRGVAREEDAGTPYALFASALRSYVNEQPVETLRRHAPGFIAGEVIKLAPQLGQKLGYVPPNPTLNPEAERARLLEQISKFFLNMAQECPTLLLLDDLHFADPGSLDILETLARHAKGASLLLAGAYRDVAVGYSNPINHHIAALASTHLAQRMQLRRLPENAVKQVLEALLGDPVSAEFAHAIYDITEGNPLFVEEVIKSLALDRQIVLREGHWEQRPSAQLHVPGSIKSVLGGRLKRIRKSTLELLQLAATIGRNFSLDLLAAASPYNEETIERAFEEAFLYQLIEVSKIVDIRSGANQQDVNVYYQFEHASIRETLYEELRPLRRRQFHRRVAAAMAQLVGDKPAEHPAVLAHHFIAGAQDEKAVPYLCQAGDIARQVHANAEAVDYFSQAREILEDIAVDVSDQPLQANLVERFNLLNQERHVLSLMGDRTRELTALEAMQEVAEALGDQTRWVEVMSRLAMYYWQVGRLNKAEEIARQALEVAQKNGDRRGEQHCLEQIARVLWTRRDSDSMNYAAQALMIAQELGDRRREGRLTELIGHIYTDTLHDPDRAALYFEQALTICRETGNRLEEAWTLWGMGGLALFVNDYPRALQRYTEAKAIAENLGATVQVGWNLYDMGNACYNLGNYEQALSHYEQAQVIFNGAYHVRGKIFALISLGLVFMVKGQRDAAGTYLEQALRQAQERNDTTLLLRSYQALAAHQQQLGGESHFTYAIRLSNEIIKRAGEGDYFEDEVLGHYLRASSLYQLSEFEDAFNSSTLAVHQLERLTYLHSPQITAAEIYYGHSQILTAVGQTEDAQAYLRTAYNETMRKANLIADESQRYDFLQNVPINRRILAASRK